LKARQPHEYCNTYGGFFQGVARKIYKSHTKEVKFMSSFNENLGNFLTECRNNALEGLNADKRYAERKQAQDEILSKLAALSPEAAALLEDYAEAAVAVQSMEYGAIMLCGLSVTSDICRRFDVSASEHKAFADEYL